MQEWRSTFVIQGMGKYICDSVDGCRGWGSTFVILEIGAGGGEIPL